MIPEHRLAYLLEEVKQGWISNCLYHNTAASPSLYVDHTCDRNDFPMIPYLELRNHTDEVWYLKYSHDGTRLASASKDSTVIVYDTTNYKALFRLLDHDAGVAHVAWSPDDSKLVTCCAQQECSAKVWDMKVRSGFSVAGSFEIIVAFSSSQLDVANKSDIDWSHNSHNQ
jgi:WD40 repeat protein